jgi:uncharacterized protein YcbX
MTSSGCGDHVAVVRAVAAYPVKGAAAAPVGSVVLDALGVVGDRRFAVLDADGQVLTADRAPALRAVRAGIGPDGAVRVDVPGHGEGLVGAAADAALTTWLARPARLAAVTAGSQLDAPVHLVSAQAVEAARRGEHAASDCACSVGEPRANLEVDLLDGVGREETWVGRDVAVGEVVLRLHRRPGHCLGVYAEVVRPGRLAAGDAVRVVGAMQSGDEGSSR